MGLPRRIGFVEIIKALYQRLMQNDTLGTAAQLSYYLLFSLFPFLFFLVSLVAYLPLGNSIEDLLSRMTALMPAQAMQILRQHLDDLLHHPRPRFLSLGLVVTIFSASRGLDAFREGLNRAYGVRETRSFFYVQLLSILMTLANACLLLLSFGLLVVGGKLGSWLWQQSPLGHPLLSAISHFRWPIGAVIVALMLAFNYYALPNVKQNGKLIAPGTALSCVCWLLATSGFTYYTQHFGSYNATYGSIGGVIILLTWLYVTGFIFLLGAEVNAILRVSGKPQEGGGAGSAQEPRAGGATARL